MSSASVSSKTRSRACIPPSFTPSKHFDSSQPKSPQSFYCRSSNAVSLLPSPTSTTADASISSSNSDFSFRRLRNALVAELSQFYKRRGVHPTRLGEVILLLSTLSVSLHEEEGERVEDTGAAFTQLAAYMHVTCGNSAYTRARLEAANHSELETGIVVKKELPD